MLCIPIFCATVFYIGALVGAYGIGAYGALAIQRAVAGDLVWIFCVCVAVLSYFAAKGFLAKCLEAIRIVRRQRELRRA